MEKAPAPGAAGAENRGTAVADRPDRWVAIGLDHQVQAASSHPVLVDGCGLAMWRAENGPVNVWEDRCPHRGMRLSYGFVRGNTLRCIYHGWGYEPGGQCVSIPAHPDLTPPKTICATVYPAETRYGIVWTNLAEAPTAPLPDVGPEEGWTPVRSVYIKRSADAVTEGIKALKNSDGGEVEAGDGIVIVRQPDGVSLMMAVQPVDAQRTGLHVVASGDGIGEPQGRLALAARMEALRGAIEAGSGRQEMRR